MLLKTRFHCLNCGHDVSDTADVACPACGDPAALDPDRHEAPLREFLFDLVVAGYLWGIPGDYRSAQREEHHRRSRAKEETTFEGLVAQKGIVNSPLRLHGTITINKREYPAVSEDDFLDQGTKVKVIDVKQQTLIVRRAE